jgi:hypothetical protein
MENYMNPDPISELGRNVMRATEGMTPEQKIAYIQQNAASGIAPQSVLFLMMKQQERLRSAQPPAQPMPTVREKLAAAAPPIQQGLGAMPTGVMNSANYAGGGIVAFQEGGNEGLEPDPAAGIGQLARDTAQRQLTQMIEQAEREGQMHRATVLRGQLRRMLTQSEGSAIGGTAFGGAKAIAESPMFKGRLPDPSAGLSRRPTTPEKKRDWASAEQQNRKTVEGTRPVDTGRKLPPPAPRMVAPAAERAPEEDVYATQLKRLEALQQAAGIGGASEAYKALLDKEEAEAGKRTAEDRRMALAQAGFAMAEAAGRPGAKFLGAAAAGGQSYVASRSAADKADREYQRSLSRERMNLLRADEQLKLGNINAAVQIQGQAEDRALKAKEVAAKNNLAYYTADLEARLGAERTRATLRGQNLEVALKLASNVADQIAGLAMDPTYLKMKPEQQEATRNKIREDGKNQLFGMLGLSSLGDTGKMSGFVFRGFE